MVVECRIRRQRPEGSSRGERDNPNCSVFSCYATRPILSVCMLRARLRGIQRRRRTERREYFAPYGAACAEGHRRPHRVSHSCFWLTTVPRGDRRHGRLAGYAEQSQLATAARRRRRQADRAGLGLARWPNRSLTGSGNAAEKPQRRHPRAHRWSPSSAPLKSTIRAIVEADTERQADIIYGDETDLAKPEWSPSCCSRFRSSDGSGHPSGRSNTRRLVAGPQRRSRPKTTPVAARGGSAPARPSGVPTRPSTLALPRRASPLGSEEPRRRTLVACRHRRAGVDDAGPSRACGVRWQRGPAARQRSSPRAIGWPCCGSAFAASSARPATRPTRW